LPERPFQLQNILPERRSTAFPHHYTPDVDMTPDATLFDLTSFSPPSTLLKITVYCLFICWQSGTDTKLIKKEHWLCGQVGHNPEAENFAKH